MSVVGLTVVVLLAAGVSEGEKESKGYRYMSNLSKYEAIRGDVRNVQIGSSESCIPKKIWIFNRHGTRLPSVSESNQINKLASMRDAVIANHEEGRGELSAEELERLKGWTFDSSVEATPMYLTQEGYNETVRKCLRFKEKFPSLLDRIYSEDEFYFQHSDFQRNYGTSYAFINGLFGDNSTNYVNNVVFPSSDDYLLYAFGGACLKLALEMEDPNIYAEANAFLQTEEALTAVENLSNRLGFQNTTCISAITTIFSACGYDSAWYQESESYGAWCDALGQEARLIGEYYCDLQYQASSGYYTEVTRRVGCAASQDLWERFAQITGESNTTNKSESVVAYFSHDTVIMSVYSALGLLNDDPVILASNYATQQHRQWRTSTMVPFASNFAAVLLECQGKYEVQFLRNEKPFEGIPNCPGGLCSWENFRSFVKPVADSCNFTEFCSN